MSRKTVAALFTIQGLGLGAAGSLLGILFGRIAASFSSGAVERTVTQFFGAAGSPSSALALKDGLEAAGLGLAVSFLASLLPALEAAKVSPKESLREGSFEQQDRKRVHILSVTGFAAVLCGALMVSIEYRYVPFRFPWLSYAGIVLFILGATLNAAPYLGAGLAILRRPLVRIFKSGAVIALGDTGGSRRRFSMALMSVAVSAALIVATVSSIYSFRKSFIAWLHTYISADLYIKSASCTSNFCFSPLPREVVESVEHLSGKEAVNRYRALPLEFHGQKIVAGFSSAALSAKYRTAISADEKERLLRLTQGREVVISDYLKVRYHLKQGDVIELLTPKGKVTFTVSGTATSYSTLSGFLYTDRRWLREYWGLDDATELTVYLRKGERTGAFASQLEQSLGNRYALDISNTDELRRAALAVFDRSFALTYAIELTAIAISLIGVVNALLILVFERKREISVLRYLGASWQQVREVMVLSAGIVGLAGLVLGLLLGSAIGLVITRVINKISFGWEVGLSFPVPLLAALAALLFVTTLLAGLVPSYLARKIDSRAFISFE
jgi:putative ABC transport system permease protein